MTSNAQLSSILHLICYSNLTDLEKQILCQLFDKSKLLTIPVKFTLESNSPIGNIYLADIAVNIGHGTALNLNAILKIAGSDFLISACTGGWYNNGQRVDLENFDFPGKPGEKFYCSFFLSPKLLGTDNQSKLLMISMDQLCATNIDPETYFVS